jgi:hypothetical protein
MNFETAKEIEICVAKYFNPRINIIVPNVWWGLGLNHECDLLVLIRTGYAYEVEIKVSRSDLLADLKKRSGHHSDLLRRLYFCIPKKLESSIPDIPERAGVLVVHNNGGVYKHREAKLNPYSKKLNNKVMLKIAHLGCMRIWKLKEEIKRLEK